MTAPDPESLERSMAAAAWLAEDDPYRAAVERRIAEAGEPAISRWRRLLAEAEAVRTALSDVSPPQQLQPRLLTAVACSESQRRRQSIAMACAGCLALAAALLATWLMPVSQVGQFSPRQSEPTSPQANPEEREPIRLVTFRDYQLQLAKSPEQFEALLLQPTIPAVHTDDELLWARPWLWRELETHSLLPR